MESTYHQNLQKIPGPSWLCVCLSVLVHSPGKQGGGFPNQEFPSFCGKVPDCVHDPFRNFLAGPLNRQREEEPRRRTNQENAPNWEKTKKNQNIHIGTEESRSWSPLVLDIMLSLLDRPKTPSRQNPRGVPQIVKGPLHVALSFQYWEIKAMICSFPSLVPSSLAF